jgi:membrane-associated phospholipid phosphatase
VTWTDEQRRRMVAVAAACVALFALLTVLAVVGSGPMDRLDRAIGREPQDLTEDNGHAASWWIWVGRVTGPREVLIVTVVVALVLLALRELRAALVVTVSMVSADWLSRGFKALVERQRPVWREPVEILHSYSFPSGHATSIAAATVLVVLVSSRWVRRDGARTAVRVAAALVALLVGADRIFLGVHNLSDVVAGYCLGTAVVLVTVLAVHRPVPRRA